MKVTARILALIALLALVPSAPVSAHQDSNGTGGAHQASFQEIYKANSPAVVVISTLDRTGKAIALGSGFIVSASGVILTNEHVIKPAAGVRLAVKLTNGDVYDDVSVIHVDARRDFAVISIKASGLPYVKLGDSDKVEVGEQVVAIGSPQGLESTFTAGVVSSVRLESKDGFRFIQHQTPISPGSSGSPLLNIKGEAVGINTFTYGGQNLNGAIPVNYAKAYLSDPPKMSYSEYAGASGLQPKQPGTPAAAPAGQPPAPPVNPEEEAAYKAFFETKDQAAAVKLGEEFIQKFPTTRYAEYAYTKLTQIYLSTQELDKLAVVGEKALAINPDNMDVLTIMCWTTARGTRSDALDATQKYDKAEKFGRRAVELLTALTKPEALTEEQFKKTRDEGLSMAHSGLGVVQFRRQLFAEAASEFEQAVKLSANPDPTDLFLHGFVLKATKRHAEAAEAFGRCGLLPGPFQDTCKKEQAENKKLAETTLTPPKP